MSSVSSFNRAEINLAALKSNFHTVKKQVNGRIMGVVKGDAYGHGLAECARALSSARCSRLGAGDLDEALAVQAAGVSARVYILSGVQGPTQCLRAVEAGLTTFAYRLEQLQDLSKAAKQLDKKALVMLKMDTGMGRLGFPFREAETIFPKVAKLENLIVDGLATQLATNGDRDSLIQLKRFGDLKNLAAGIFRGPLTHSALTSGGILAHPDYQDDMSRIGLMLYGYSPLKEDHPGLFDLPASKPLIRSLLPVMAIKSQILSIKTIKNGDTVSFDRLYAAKKDTPVATVPMGYASGLSQARSGRGRALIGGRSAPLLGRVCMTETMYDVSQIAVLPGQEAVLLGDQGAESIRADELAALEGVTPYEILCLAGSLNPRHFISV
jgi:alanine racemase